MIRRTEQPAPVAPVRFPDEADPLSEVVLSYLFSQSYESPNLDFKEIIETAKSSNFAKIARHFFGMANYGGGFVLVGFRPKPTGGYLPVGLPESFHIDQAELQGKFNAFASTPLAVGYRELERVVEGETKRFAVIYIPPGPDVVVPASDGYYRTSKDRQKTAFHAGEILIRRGTSTIKASPAEIAWIRARAKDTAYRISLLSGEPDLLDETLSSNIFLASQIPPRAYSCQVDLRGGSVPRHGMLSCLVEGRVIYSFENPAQTPLGPYILDGSTRVSSTSAWRQQPDQSRRLIQLFESAIVHKGNAVGLEYEWQRKRFFYPLDRGNLRREEEWAGITKRATRQVAVRRYLGSLKREVVIHSTVQAGFLWVENALHLRLEPGFLLSEDGLHPLRGQKHGNVLISLESWLSSHNAGYLRNVLFWSSRFQDSDGVIRLGPDLEFSGKPLQVRVKVGIREDTLGAMERHRPGDTGDAGGSLDGA